MRRFRRGVTRCREPCLPLPCKAELAQVTAPIGRSRSGSDPGLLDSLIGQVTDWAVAYVSSVTSRFFVGVLLRLR